MFKNSTDNELRERVSVLRDEMSDIEAELRKRAAARFEAEHRPGHDPNCWACRHIEALRDRMMEMFGRSPSDLFK